MFIGAIKHVFFLYCGCERWTIEINLKLGIYIYFFNFGEVKKTCLLK